MANSFSEIMTSSMIFQFKTNNVILDTIINSIIIISISYLATNFTYLKIYIIEVFKKLFYQNNSILIIGYIVKTEYIYCSFSEKFNSILNKINKLNCNEAGIYRLKETDTKSKKEDFFVEQKDSFKVEKNVYIKIYTSNEILKDKVLEEIKIEVYSKVLSMNDLKQTMNTWLKDYRLENNLDNDNLKYFIHKNNKEETYNNYHEYNFTSNKNFKNVFFEGKKDLINKIDYFENNEQWYKTKGIPYTLGMMFHGKPGCGKTSIIKAISNYTHRHIFAVKLDKIKNFNELVDIFYNIDINCKRVPINKRLFIIEDIDCTKFKELIKTRSTDEQFTVKNSDFLTKEMLYGEKSSIFPGQTVTNDKNLLLTKILNDLSENLTLSDILNVLDGILEIDGRMLIITTNYPEKIDEALLRPGRIDIKIELKEATSEIIKCMYEYFYDTKYTSNKNIPNKVWTPSEIIQIFIQNIDNPTLAINTICK
uniref:AAA+ ATPase domain-containing protein n=1 Tax=viral metagenome TaxID=1070528 RepID=A0A6C0JEK4_9ZZZZ